MTKTDLKNKLKLQLSEDMREFAIINNLTEQDVKKIRDNKLIPEPHLGFLTALLKDKNLEFHKVDKLKKFTYSSCSIINIGINTHENNSCPRGEIGRHKGLKSRGKEVKDDKSVILTKTF